MMPDCATWSMSPGQHVALGLQDLRLHVPVEERRGHLGAMAEHHACIVLRVGASISIFEQALPGQNLWLALQQQEI